MAIVGGVSDVTAAENSAEIDTLARFAVDQYNNKQNAVLEFVKVIKAKKQVVAGTLYYITLEANDGANNKLYETKVLEKAWLNSKEVLEFQELSDTATTGNVITSSGRSNT